jgi:LAS superfamily LD-carboxypeptidase LdcB
MDVTSAGGSVESCCHHDGGPVLSNGNRPGRPRGRLLTLFALSVAMVALGVLPGSAQTDTSTTATTATTAPTTSETTATTSSQTTATTAATTATTAATTASTTATTAAGGTTTTGAGSDVDKERVEAAESSKARELDAANARMGDLNDALADLEGQLEAQSAEVDIASQRLAAAQQVADAAQEDVADLEEQVRQIEANLGDQAIRSYKGDAVADTVIVGTDPDKAMRMQTMLAKATQSDIDYANLLAAAKEDLLARRRDAEGAVREADESRAEGERQLAELEKDRLAYGQLASAAENRIDHLLTERAVLAQLGAEVDAGLDVDIDEELVARLAAASSRAPTTDVRAPIPVADGEIVSAGNGIMVHESIAADVRQLLADAAAAGVVLAGGGYRDPAGQIAVRRSNCGTSNYAIYEMPSSQCSPPTARPGRSMHEQGRAIDFTYNGRIISSRSGPAWNWLKANAERYGLYNLPSEPWHWSTNGR